MRRGLVFAVVGLLVLAGALYAWYPPFHLATLVMRGKSPSCPLGQAVRSEANELEQIAAKDRILRASRRLETDAEGYELWQTPRGTYWVPAGSRYVLPFNLAEQERKIYGTGAHYVQAGDIVLDCGANLGVFTREALEAGAKQVIAIEPAPENVECLRRTFAKEIADKRVILVPEGVWNKRDVLALTIDPENSAADSFVLQPAHVGKQIQVPLTTVDLLVQQLQLPRVDFIKMDIEGAEVKALEGARATLQQHHPRLSISAYHQDDHPVAIPAMIRQARPEYNVTCGPCAKTENGVIRPDILYFQ